MNKVLFAFLLVITVLAGAPLLGNNGGVDPYILIRKQAEVLRRSLKSPKPIAVSPERFEEVVLKQLAARYSARKKDGKVELVPYAVWREEAGEVKLVQPPRSEPIPFFGQFKVVEVVFGDYVKAKSLNSQIGDDPEELVYLKVFDGTGLPEALMLGRFIAEPDGFLQVSADTPLKPAFRMLEDNEFTEWDLARLDYFIDAAKAGKTFLVKAPTYKFKCPLCNRASRRKGPGKGKADPECPVCKGTNFFRMEEFRLMKLQ